MAKPTDRTEPEDHADIREGVRALCARYPGEYWRKLDRDRTYPAEFVGGTGAGDAFSAGYIAGLLEGGDPLDCLRLGSALGASCVQSVSATDSVFNRQQARDFMAAHELPIEPL